MFTTILMTVTLIATFELVKNVVGLVREMNRKV